MSTFLGVFDVMKVDILFFRLTLCLRPIVDNSAEFSETEIAISR